MNTFYSVLYIKPEPISEERISVGLFLNTDNKPVFDYSEEKLKIAAKLVGSDTVDSLEKLLRNIKKKTVSISEDENQVEAFEVNPFSESYFKYLNKYSNNILKYSNPSENHGDFELGDYRDLFRLLIDKEYGADEDKNDSFRTSVKKKVNSSVVKEKMDVFYKVPKNSVKGIYRDHIVDYIGYSDSIISGNSVDMTRDPYNLENKFYLLRILTNGLLDLAKKLEMDDQGKHIVFYNEPEGSKNKDLLYDAMNDDTSPLFFKQWEEFEEEESWIANNPLKRFSQLNLSN